MQPNAPNNGYTQQPFTANPYAQQAPLQVPIAPKPSRVLSFAVIVSFVITIVLLLAAIGFAAWAYMSMQDYKNNSDKKVAAAVEKAKQEESAAKDAEYAEKLKDPFKTYQGPSAYGSLNFQYPKTWSAMITEGTNKQAPIDGYFFPDYLPGVQPETAFALRVQVLPGSYSSTSTKYSSAAERGEVKISPVSLPKMPDVVGVRIEGQLTQKVRGILIYLPLRDKTLAISTQNAELVKDFENIVLSSFTFEP